MDKQKVVCPLNGILLNNKKKLTTGNSLAVHWLGLWASTAGGPGLIPGQGTKVLQATWRGRKKKKRKKKKKKLTNIHNMDEHQTIMLSERCQIQETMYIWFRLYEKSRKKNHEDGKKINGAKGGDRVGVETNFRDMTKPLGVTEMF